VSAGRRKLIVYRSTLTSDVEVVAAGGEVVGPVVGGALVPAHVIPADGGKVEEALCALHHRRLTIIWGRKNTQHKKLIIFIWQATVYLNDPKILCFIFMTTLGDCPACSVLMARRKYRFFYFPDHHFLILILFPNCGQGK
jgi:hypothetical protein